MGCRYTSSSFFIHVVMIMWSFRNGDRVMARENLIFHDEAIQAAHNKIHEKTSVLRLESMDSHERTHPHLHMSHMDLGHVDPSVNVFLTEKDLKVGKTMPIYFPRINPSSSPHFLPREESNSIPFTTTKLHYLLQLFSFSSNSPQAKAMSDTLTQCEVKPIEGETKTCATSLESMLDFTHTIFGKGTSFKIITTTHNKNRTPDTHPLLQNYTMLSISKDLSEGKMVACHTMPYPYAVFYCHYQKSKSKVFKVSVISEFDEKVEAVVVCHMDTSAWDSDHVSFRMLGIKPGMDSVCHFFPEDHLVWVPTSIT